MNEAAGTDAVRRHLQQSSTNSSQPSLQAGPPQEGTADAAAPAQETPRAPPPPPPAPPPDKVVRLGNGGRVAYAPVVPPDVEPADITPVNTATEFQAAVEAGAQDIEVHSHLDLSALDRKENPVIACFSQDRIGRDSALDAGTLASHLAYVKKATRSIRGRCSGPVPPDVMEAWESAMSHSPLPLKPHQCLVLTRSKALFATAGTLWIDNIYFASIDPLGSSGRHNLFLSTNYPHTVRDTSNAFVENPAAASEDCTTVRDLRVFLTDVVMHGRPAGGSQTLSLAPINTHMSVALLAQDSVFIGMEGMRPPILVTRYAKATFSNCLFKDIYIQGHELFDVSNSGNVRLSDCKLSNVTTGRDVRTRGHVSLADTSYNDPGPFSDDDFARQTLEFCGMLLDDFIGPDFNVSQPSAEDERELGVDGWVREETVTDGIDSDPDPSEAGECAGDWSPVCPVGCHNGRVPQPPEPADAWLAALREVLPPPLEAPDGAWDAFHNRLPRCGGCRQPLPLLERLSAAGHGFVAVPNLTMTPPPIAATPGNTSANADWPPPSAAPIPHRVAVYTLCGVGAAVVLALTALVLLLLFRRHRRRQPRGTSSAQSAKLSHAGDGAESGFSTRAASSVSRDATAPVLADDPLPVTHATGDDPIGIHVGTSAMHSTAHSMMHTTASSGIGDAHNAMYKYKLPAGLSLLVPSKSGASADLAGGGGGDGGGMWGGGGMSPEGRTAAGGGAAGLATDRAVNRLVRASMAQKGDGGAEKPPAAPLVACEAGAGERGEAEEDAHAPGGRDAPEGFVLPLPPPAPCCELVQMYARDAVEDVTTASSTASRPAAARVPPAAPPEAPPRKRLPARGHLFTTEESEAHGSTGAPAAEASGPVRAPHPDVGLAQAASDTVASNAVRRLHLQLDRFMPSDLFLGRFELLGRWERRQGGQAIVQFAREEATGVDYAIKYFLDPAAYLAEAAIYESNMPSFCRVYRATQDGHRSPQPRPPRVGSDRTSLAPSQATSALESAEISMTKTVSHPGAGTLAAVTAAYSVATSALFSIGNRSADSRAAVSDGTSATACTMHGLSGPLGSIGENSVHTRGIRTFLPNSTRRMCMRPPPPLPLGDIVLGEEPAPTHSVAKYHPHCGSQSSPKPSGEGNEEGPPAGLGGSGFNGSTSGMQSAGVGGGVCEVEMQDQRRGPGASLRGESGPDADGTVMIGASIAESGCGSTAADCSLPKQHGELGRCGGGGASTDRLHHSTVPSAVGDGTSVRQQPTLRDTAAPAADDESERTAAAPLQEQEDPAQAPLIPEAAAKFLPRVEAVCEVGAAQLVDPRGRPLPPCIVMEKGESLHDWSDRAQPDLFSAVSVLSNVAKRLAAMHECGLVHRDLKPSNIMWLPRENRWTVIDFGSAARTGEVAPLSFSLAYAAPEVVATLHHGERRMRVTPAVDAWAIGVVAFELLTGAPAFNFLTDGSSQVVARLLGELSLPWEGDLPAATRAKLGIFKAPVLRLLHRDPAQRATMADFCSLCQTMFMSPGASTYGGYRGNGIV